MKRKKTASTAPAKAARQIPKLKRKLKPSTKLPRPKTDSLTNRYNKALGLIHGLREQIAGLTSVCDDRVNSFREERRNRESWQKRYEELERRLVNLLSPDQLEAAKFSNCDPISYALGLIRLVKQRLEEITAGFR